MPTHKADIRIGQRAMEELYRVFPGLTETKIACLLGLDRRLFWEWKNSGTTPSGFALQRMCFCGCDINYILKGRRDSDYMQTVDKFTCSVCGGISMRGNYCPNCGAKMDGDGNA